MIVDSCVSDEARYLKESRIRQYSRARATLDGPRVDIDRVSLE